ncbi:MAG: response regulator transcription factor [Bacilli bacterium]|nr:response regulator transcription factor [Bacilli bacterium]
MLKIAILDDDKTALMISTSAVEAFLKEKNAEYRLFSFSNPLNFLASAKEEKFDLSFLDIDMPEMNGLSVANELAAISKYGQIIFLSQREDLVFECLKFHPFGFIRKSKLIDDFSLMMNQFFQTVANNESNETKIDFFDKTKTYSFKIKDIVYIEGDRNYQKVVLKDKSSQNIRVPLGTLEEKLREYGFLRIHKGYLLNYLYIRSIENEEVYLTTGTSLPMAKKRKEEIMKQYLAISRKNSSVII